MVYPTGVPGGAMLLPLALSVLAVLEPPPPDTGACSPRLGPTAASYEYSVMGHRGSLEYGFVATPRGTLCHYYGTGDRSASCAIARLPMTFSTPGQVVEAPSPEVLVGALRRAARAPCEGPAREGPERYAIVTVRAETEVFDEVKAERRLEHALALVAQAIARCPPEVQVVVNAAIWRPSNSPPPGSVCAGRDADPPADLTHVFLAVDSGDRVDALQGHAIGPAPSPEVLGQLLAMAEKPGMSDFGFHAPIITLEGCREGRKIEPVRSRHWRGWSESQRQTLRSTFDALCGPALISARQVPLASEADLMRSRSRCEAFTEQARKQYEEVRKVMPPTPPAKAP